MTDRLDDHLFGESGQVPGSGRPKRRRARRGVVILLAVVLFAIGIALAYTLARPAANALFGAKDYEGAGSGSTRVLIEDGATGRDIAANLERSGVVKTARAFESALSDTPGPALQPGTYELRREMSAASALAALRDPASKVVVKVTVREGLWKSEIYDLLSKATGHSVQDYQAAAEKPALLGLPTSAKGNLEGYLFPQTYSFQPGSSPADQLRAMIAETIKQTSDLGITEAQRPRLLIMASLVEGEAQTEADRAKVTRVILNRLAAGQRLQLDSTVNYAVQRRSVTTTDAERAQDKGYGTYARDGLPVAPIGNPGVSSLRAAMHPAAGPWLFFVTVNPDTGETRFATTDTEHMANVKLFQGWCAANPGRC